VFEFVYTRYGSYMDVARPYAAVAPTLDGDVLVVLAGTTQPLTGARVAKLVRRGTDRGVQKALDRLVEQGIVRRQPAGRAYLHVLNRDHVTAPIVLALAGLRAELLTRLRKEFGAWDPPPVHASLFGSAARGDGDTESDIDLLVVRPATVDEEDAAWRDQVDRLGMHVESWTGNHAGVIELSETELGLPSPALRDVRSEGVDLVGTPIRLLLRDRP
jgi:Nucleotidyltransferase domain